MENKKRKNIKTKNDCLKTESMRKNKRQQIKLKSKNTTLCGGNIATKEAAKFLSKLGLKKITRGYNSFSSGDKRELINLGSIFNDKLILPLICYEIIYPAKIKEKEPEMVDNINKLKTQILYNNKENEI